MAQQRIVTIRLHSEMKNTIDTWLGSDLAQGWSIASVHTTGVGAPAMNRHSNTILAAAVTWVVVVLERA